MRKRERTREQAAELRQMQKLFLLKAMANPGQPVIIFTVTIPILSIRDITELILISLFMITMVMVRWPSSLTWMGLEQKQAAG